MKTLKMYNACTVLKHSQHLALFGFLLLSNGQTANAGTNLKLTAYPISQQITLQWAKITGATGYRLCYATESIKDINACSTYANGIQKDTTSTKLTLTKLTNGTAYYFRVIATNTGSVLSTSKLVTATPQPTINDTGISASQCYQPGSDALVVCNSPAAVSLSKTQDGIFGRDASVITNSKADGHAGFNFTKISSTGVELTANSKIWSCIKDNVTGLIWEIKTADGGLRDWQNTYTNYSTASGTPTDANVFVTTVNAQTLCGASDWRLPTASELQSIIDYSIAYPNPMIDTAFFPNTRNTTFWSSSPDTDNADYAWYASFSDGKISNSDRFHTYTVRLVRGGQ